MQLKVHSKNCCPACGRTDAAHRVSRGRFVRWMIPNSKLMRCRLCLTQYMVRKTLKA